MKLQLPVYYKCLNDYLTKNQSNELFNMIKDNSKIYVFFRNSKGTVENYIPDSYIHEIANHFEITYTTLIIRI